MSNSRKTKAAVGPTLRRHKGFARVAQLSAEEAFRLLGQKHHHEEQSAWSRFETELAKRTSEINERYKDELRLARSEKETLTHRFEDSLREVAEVRERNQQLGAEMAKFARVGKREELDFAEEARTWAGMCRVDEPGLALVAGDERSDRDRAGYSSFPNSAFNRGNPKYRSAWTECKRQPQDPMAANAHQCASQLGDLNAVLSKGN